MTSLDLVLDSLERVAVADAVDDEFRRKVLWNQLDKDLSVVLFEGIMLGLGSVAVFEGGGGWNNANKVLLSVLGPAIIGNGIVTAWETYKVRREYLAALRNGTFKNGFYYLNNRISALETPVEKAYGVKIEPGSFGMLNPSSDSPSYDRRTCYFIDGVSLEDISSEYYSDDSGRGWLSPRCDREILRTDCVSDIFDRLRDYVGMKVAMLFQPAYNYPDCDMPLHIMAMRTSLCGGVCRG